MNEQDKLEILKEILFTDDRQFIDRISKRIEILEGTVNERKKLAQKVDPIVEHQLKEFTQNIPTTLGPAITAALKEEIKNHKNEVVDVLYPLLGKMIKKYIAQEIRLLSERINKQLRFQGWKRKFKSWFGGVKESDIVLSELASSQIEQVLLIERESGLLVGSFSRAKTIDEELISGMLTAIKSFVEDAYHQKDQNLELIEYELYNIHLQSFISHFVAVVISGNYDLESKAKVQDLIFNFYEEFMSLKKKGNPSKRSIERRILKTFKDADI